MLFYVLELWW